MACYDIFALKILLDVPRFVCRIILHWNELLTPRIRNGFCFVFRLELSGVFWCCEMLSGSYSQSHLGDWICWLPNHSRGFTHGRFPLLFSHLYPGIRTDTSCPREWCRLWSHCFFLSTFWFSHEDASLSVRERDVFLGAIWCFLLFFFFRATAFDLQDLTYCCTCSVWRHPHSFFLFFPQYMSRILLYI